MIAHSERTIELDPRYPLARLYLGLAYASNAMYEQAIAELHQSVALSAGNPQHVGALGYVLATAGQRPAAEGQLEQLERMARDGYVPATSVALVHAGLGQADRAFEWLNRAYDTRDAGLIGHYLKSNPAWDSLRDDPRFGALLDRMRLPR